MTNDILDFTSEQFKELYNKLEGEPEFKIYFSNHSNVYMIIKYSAKVSFQRCGVSNGSGEFYFDSLNSLFAANTIDNICLVSIHAEAIILSSTSFDDFCQSSHVTDTKNFTC